MRFADLINQQVERYRIEALIGCGGMAAVYRAFDTRLQRSVALKVLYPHYLADADVRARFTREAITAAQLDHPNIVPIYDVGETDDLVYLAMKLLPGPSLAEVLQREGRLSLARLLPVACDIAAALEAAHRRGIIHRDIKPGNVLFDGQGRALLSDFGIAKSLDAPALTESSVIVGTPDYLAPEQIDPRLAPGGQLDHRADIYALGVLLYRALTGRRPFDGAAQTVLLAHLQQEPLPPSALAPELPPKLDRVLLRAMAKDPQQRYNSAAELVAALSALGNSAPADAAPRDDATTAIGQLIPPAARRRAAYSAATTDMRRQLPPPAGHSAARRRAGLLAGGLLVLLALAVLLPTLAAREEAPAPVANAPTLGSTSGAAPTATASATPGATPSLTPSAVPSATPSATSSPNPVTADQRPASLPAQAPVAHPPTSVPPTIPPARPTPPPLAPSPTAPPPTQEPPTPTAVGCHVALTGGFGYLWRTNAAVRAALGCPLEPERAGYSVEQLFERGLMYYREEGGLIWALNSGSGTWRAYGDLGPDHPEPSEAPPSGLIRPVRGFGRVWQAFPAVREALGWATTPEVGFTGVLQRFEGGTLLFAPAVNGQGKRVYVLYNNGAYAGFRDQYTGP